MRRIFTLLAVFGGLVLPAAAQNSVQDTKAPPSMQDTTYIKSFKGSIITRVYFSRNTSHIQLDPTAGLPTMKYHANTPLNIGVGFAYHWFSVSISKGLGFLQSDSKKGHTKSFDLQTHIYKRKWTLDALAQFYQGYYLSSPNGGASNGPAYYLRPDMRLRMVGLNFLRVLNDRRFSYGASLGQGALQQKSAGSFLIGANAFYTAINADSALAPYKVDSLYNKSDIRKFHLFSMGIGIGYAYTFVFDKNWFLLGSANMNLNANFSREIGNSIKRDKVGISYNYILRFGAGYNTNRWGLSAQWFTGGLNAEGPASDYKYAMQTGSYRLIYVRRIAINRRMKTILNKGYTP